jgi:hypothetical protein
MAASSAHVHACDDIVIIALLSLPLVSFALGSVGRAPLLEEISRAAYGCFGRRSGERTIMAVQKVPRWDSRQA